MNRLQLKVSDLNSVGDKKLPSSALVKLEILSKRCHPVWATFSLRSHFPPLFLSETTSTQV